MLLSKAKKIVLTPPYLHRYQTKKLHISLFCLSLCALSVFSACSSTNPASILSNDTSSQQTPSTSITTRDTTAKVLQPQASAITAVSSSDGNAIIDTSNSNNGYVMIQYTGDNPKVKVSIEKKGSSDSEPPYTYIIKDYQNYNVYPLSLGNGDYSIQVLEQASQDMYATILQADTTITLTNEYSPFLYPNAYVNFNLQSATVAKGVELATGASNDIEVICHIFDFVTANISYDDQLAATVESGYISDVDRTLASQKGICFDYASLMAAMLRSQGIPTKLVFGHVGELYHAWISCYTDETGWMEKIIEFNGKDWEMLDPTFWANSNGKRQSVVGDGTNYQAKYIY